MKKLFFLLLLASCQKNILPNSEWQETPYQTLNYEQGVAGEFYKSKTDSMRTLVVFNGKVKMIIQGAKVPGGIRYSYLSSAGKLHLAITVSGGKGRDMEVGESPDFTPLGVRGGESFRTDVAACKRNTGFKTCVVCAHKECDEDFWCLVTCGVSGATCIVAWIVSCAIINSK